MSDDLPAKTLNRPTGTHNPKKAPRKRQFKLGPWYSTPRPVLTALHQLYAISRWKPPDVPAA